MHRIGSSSLPRLCARVGLVLAVALAGQAVMLPAASATTTLSVSTTADTDPGAGACGDASITAAPSPLSLREATCLANNIGGDVTINVPAGSYGLSYGELRLGAGPGQDIALTGAGPAATVIDAGGLSRVLELDFNLTGGIAATISGLTLRGGSDDTFGGGGIIAGSGISGSPDSLTITGSVISGNQTSAAATNLPGGGVQFVGGSLSIVNSTISGNSSGNSPGAGVYYLGEGAAAGEHLSISASTVSGNTADATAGANGGALWLSGASYDISSTRFLNNSVTGSLARGGGIWSQGGALSVTGSTFTGNTAAAGGALAVDGGSAVLHYNRLTGNTATSGSAVSSGIGAGLDATENWWGCTAGPGSAGCDTVAGGPTVLPRLVLTASANPAAVTGPNATSTITAALTRDSVGAAVDPAQLGAFDGLPVSWSNPQPSGATLSVASSNISTGTAVTTYNSNATGGTGQVTAALDQGPATATLTVTLNQPPAVTSTDHTSFVAGQAESFTITTTGLPSAALSHSGAQFPAWLTLTDHGNGTGALTGTPPSGSGGTYQFTLQATNSAGQATQTFTLTVNDSPVITSADHTTFTAGQAGSFTVTTTAGYPTGTALAESGALPSGLTFHDNGDGTATLAGTPAAGGTYPISITATAVGGLASPASQSFTLTVQAPPVITSTDHTTFSQGSAGSFTVTTAAGNPVSTTLSHTGTLPSGISFVDNGNGTATIGGTPGAGSGGVYPITITAGNGVAPDATQVFTLTVNAVPVITSADHATLTVGVPVSFTVTTDGQPMPALSKTGSLPPGMTFTDNGDGTATLGGTPTAGGSYTFTITASNGVLPKATQSFTATVYAAPVITSINNATFAVGTAGSFTVTTTPGIPAATTITESGALPSGLTFIDNGNGTATLSGTPAAGTGGSYVLTLTASNSVPPNSTQAFGLTVTDVPVITSADHTTFAVGTAGSFTVTTRAGFPTVTSISEAGVLPAGMTFTDNGNGTATLAGTPAAGSGGSYPVTLSASNSGGHADQTFTVAVNEIPRITSANLVTFTAGSAGSFTLTTVAGYPTATALTESGALPSGVTFTDNGDGTATLAGTPTVGTGGSYPLTFTATNTVGHVDQAFTLTVLASPAITSADHTTFKVGSAGSFTVTTTAGNPAATTLTESGALPSGVTFRDSGNGTATLSGTPAAGTGGSYSLTITASNGVLPNTTQAFTLTVNGPPVITSANNTAFLVGSAGTFAVITSPTATSITKTGTLPSGVTFTNNGNGTATLAGTPAAGTGGSYSLTITASNGVLPNATQAFTLTVGAPPSITSANKTSFTEFQAGTFTVTTSGGFPRQPALTRTGILPTGVTFSDNGNGTATLSGTPADYGSFPLTIKANNGVAPAVSQSFTLTVIRPMTVDSPGTQTGIVGVAKSLQMQLEVNGTAPYTWSATGLPPGKTISASTGLISGTPTSGGNYLSTVTVRDWRGATASASVRWLIGTPGSVIVTNPGTQTGFVGDSVSLRMDVSGGIGSYTWSATGLPTGSTLESTGRINGDLWVAGTYRVRITATDITGVTGSTTFTWTVTTGPFTVNNPGSQTGAVGTSESLTVVATGGTGPYTWSATGLPPGLTLSASTGRVANDAPTTVGTYSVTVTATDANNTTKSVSFSWYVSPMQIADPGAQRWEIGVPVNLQMQLLVSGSGPYTWSATALPPGVTISATTGLISGVPTNTGSLQDPTVSVTDSTGAKASLTLTEQTAKAVQLINTVGSVTRAVGQSYQLLMRATDGSTPYAFSATNLPPGFSISADGLISGAATTSGTYAVKVVVTDAAGATDSSSGTWTINP